MVEIVIPLAPETRALTIILLPSRGDRAPLPLYPNRGRRHPRRGNIHPNIGVSPLFKRNMGRPYSAFGDYRPNMESIKHPRPDTSPHSFQSTQSPLTDFDRFTLVQMMGMMSLGLPETPPARVETPVQTRGGGGDGGGRGGGGGDGGEADGGGGDDGRKNSTHYTKNETIVVTRAWDVVTSDTAIGNDQTELSFLRRVVVAYDEFKPIGATPREPDQLRKKWSRIMRAIKRFAGIYENNMRTVESGRSEADVKALSFSQFNTEGWPKFGY